MKKLLILPIVAAMAFGTSAANASNAAFDKFESLCAEVGGQLTTWGDHYAQLVSKESDERKSLPMCFIEANSTGECTKKTRIFEEHDDDFGPKYTYWVSLNFDYAIMGCHEDDCGCHAYLVFSHAYIYERSEQ
ncbi:MAG: hypothetical protein LBH81_03935 [Rickettsiales bacterium]|jgi:hypothetical protein|nr:hypothetical protein [Rickettsiales bacterium]